LLMRIGVVNPGAMGVTVAACAAANGHKVVWCSEGRSQATKLRVANDCPEIVEVESMQLLANESEMIICVCPPHGAHDVAKQVAELKEPFRGLYVDANAVSTDTLSQIHKTLDSSPIAGFVDGSIIGPPATVKGKTRLYIAGSTTHTKIVEDIFQGTNLQVITIGEKIGSASALKMAYSAYGKGTSALLLSILALAKTEEVLDPLIKEWQQSAPEVANRYEKAILESTPKAWRFVGEMGEIAHTFQSCGLSPNFHIAAGDTFSKLSQVAEQLNNETKPTLTQVLDTFVNLCGKQESAPQKSKGDPNA